MYIEYVAPTSITSKCRHWQSNDGDGLNAANSRKLAEFLQREIDSGRTKAYALVFQSQQEMTPDEVCWLCEGTGTRKPPPNRGAGDLKTGMICNACEGRGVKRPMSTDYPFDVENVQDLIAFLRDCGGFKIC
jgi:hypothetical protein